MLLLAIIVQLQVALAVPADWWTRSCSYVIASNPAIDNVNHWQVPGLQRRHMGSDDDDGSEIAACSNPAYILTLWDCINVGASLMPAMGRDPKQGLDDSFAYNRWNCQYEKSKFIYTREELDELYAKYKISQTYEQAAESLEGPFTVNATLLEPYAIPEMHYHDARFYSEVFSQVIVYFISGILILQMLINFCTWKFPAKIEAAGNSKLVRLWRKYVTLRPLLNEKYSRLFDLYSTPFPYICLFITFVLNYVFMGINLNPSNPEPLYPNSSMATGTYLGYRSGMLCMYKLPFVFVFGTRNNIFIWATGWDQAVFNHWHTWLARMVVIDGFIHTGAYVVHFGHKDAMAAWSDAYWTCGFIALLCWTLMMFHGTSFLKKLRYDFFRVCHILLGIASVATLWYHLDYTNKVREIWYTIVAVWLFDWCLRVIRLNASGICDVIVESTTDNYLTMYVRDNSPVRPYIGANYFVYFWHWSLFWQSHPFTVVEYTDGYMKFICKVHNGATKTIYNRARANGGTCTLKVGLEGPMGVKFNFKSFENFVFCAGGIGVTAVYAHLRPWIQNGADRPITIHWAIRDMQPLEWFSDEIESIKAAGIRLNLYVTGGDCTPGSTARSLACDSPADTELLQTKEQDIMLKQEGIPHMDFQAKRPRFDEIVADEITNSKGSTVFFACGAPEMNRVIRENIAKSLDKTQNYVQFYEEAFC